MLQVSGNNSDINSGINSRSRSGINSDTNSGSSINNRSSNRSSLLVLSLVVLISSADCQ